MKTLGEKRVRIDHNTSFNDNVTKVKRLTADLIDMCDKHKEGDPRLMALAMTHYEVAAMFAVKALTAIPEIK